MARTTRQDKAAAAVLSPPEDAEALRQFLMERYSGLSAVFQRIARFVIDEPNIVALETLAVVAERCGAPASTIVRFAQSLGFEGAGPMQRLLRDSLLIGNGGRTYGERVRRFASSAAGEANDPRTILRECAEGAAHALEHIDETVSPDSLRQAAGLVRGAEFIYLVGFRRAFPVAAYLSYGLQRLGRRTLLIDGAAGLSKVQAENATSRDLLIAVSFTPYAPETVETVETALARDCPLLSVTDSVVSPIARAASSILLIREPDIRGFRPLTTTMCVAQALILACAFDEA